MKSRVYTFTGLIIMICLLSISCRTTKFVPDNEFLLNETLVTANAKGISSWEMRSHISQRPNFKTFEIFKIPLSVYNLSGKDSTKWLNRTLRKGGEPPVIYDSTQVNKSVSNLKRAMTNKGYLNAKVTPKIELKNKKARIEYLIESGQQYKINQYTIHINDSSISQYDTLSYQPRAFLKKKFKLAEDYKFNLDTILHFNSLVTHNTPFDLDMLDKERERITYALRRTGYYALNKEYIGFVADTAVGNNKVDIELSIKPFPRKANGEGTVETPHIQYEVASVDFYIDHNPIETGSISNYVASEIYTNNNYTIHYGERGNYIKPHIVIEKCFVRPGSLYDEEMTALTYAALYQLRILKNINISYQESNEGGTPKLHCIITCVPDKRQGISTELEGTNSGGFFGIGAGLGYMHRNAFRGSEQFSIGVRGAYEAITPSFSNFNDNYFEFGGEASLNFPRFMFPFLNRDFRKQIQATTQLNANYTIQRRPGFFHRTVMGSALQYTWNDRQNSLIRHTIDLVDVSYAHIPRNKLDTAFYNQLSPAAQRYSFDDQFIMSTGYTYSTTNSNLKRNQLKPTYSFRASVETAGNVLNFISKLTDAKKGKEGSREVFGTQFAQYIKGTADYTKTYYIDEKNAVAWRLGGGIAYPYGNYKLVPIQKRFFSGGANNVRGWGVRELGPGSFYPTSNDKKTDNFYYHSGDIRLDANIEYRNKLFWIVELGAFVDAGNIWTVQKYDDQPKGEFRLDSFYREIAFAWGLGLRLDFNFVLIRLDCGWKAYDPSGDPNKTKWPIKYPHKIKKNTAWHIAVGYPF